MLIDAEAPSSFGNISSWGKFLDSTGHLTLRLPEKEMMGSTFPVAKRGNTSGLTYGTKSGIEAVVRHCFPDGNTACTWEMLIVERSETTPFSDKGDSGSCVFDFYGHIVGLVVGSSDGKSEDTWRDIPQEGQSTSQKLKRRTDNLKSDTAATTAATVSKGEY